MGMKKILIFGGSGEIGSGIVQKFESENWSTLCVGRSKLKTKSYLSWDPFKDIHKDDIKLFSSLGPFDSVCWAQGINLSDSIYNFERELHENLYKANVTYTLESLKFLLQNKLIKQPAKFCVISSIWQNLSKENKLSYSISKAALKGLVMSLSNDLAKEGHLFNAVLPGVINSPMTRENLTQEQISSVKNATQFNRLASVEDVANSVYSLCSDHNSGITGNFLNIDLGFSNVRNI